MVDCEDCIGCLMFIITLAVGLIVLSRLPPHISIIFTIILIICCIILIIYIIFKCIDNYNYHNKRRIDIENNTINNEENQVY